MDAKTYNIPEANLEALKARVAKLSKKAEKLCGEAIVLTVGWAFDVPRKDKPEAVDRFYPVTVTGPQPRINGWALAAALDVVDADGEKLLIVRNAPGHEIPESFRQDKAPGCNHCNASRNRKTVYVCVHDDGGFKQVGSSCLADFLGHISPENLVKAFELVAAAADACDDYEGLGGDGIGSRFDLGHYLGYVVAAITADGWLSRGSVREQGFGSASADTAMGAMIAKMEGKTIDPKYVPAAAAWARVEAAMAYLSTYLETHGEDNDYLHNLDVVVKTGSVTYKTAGLAASIIVTAEREQGREIERRKYSNLKETSVYLGAVGEKVVVRGTCVAKKELEGDYGIGTMLRFVAGGSVAVWFASGIHEEFEVGGDYVLIGRIKKVEEYQGVKQTLVTRCSLVTEEALAAEAAKAEKKTKKLTLTML